MDSQHKTSQLWTIACTLAANELAARYPTITVNTWIPSVYDAMGLHTVQLIGLAGDERITLANSIPVFMKLAVLDSRHMSSWTEQEIMEYSFMTGQGWTL